MLTGRRAFVTGAGSGIGRAISRVFAENGARVAIADINLEAAGRVAGEIREAGGQVVAVETDVTSPGSVATAIETTAGAFGGIDILVNNAGIYPMRKLEQISLDEWNHVVDVNLTGVFICTQAALPYLKKSDCGRIINMSSLAGQTGGILAPAHYAATKAGIIGFTKVLASALAQHGITANCIAPGTTETPGVAKWDPPMRERLLHRVPLGRLGRPEDVAAAALYLASDGAAWVTGATLDVSGGLAMR